MISFNTHDVSKGESKRSVKAFFLTWYLLLACGISISVVIATDSLYPYERLLIAAIVIFLGIIFSRHMARKGIGLGMGLMPIDDTYELEIVCETGKTSFWCLLLGPLTACFAAFFSHSMNTEDLNSAWFGIISLAVPVASVVIGMFSMKTDVIVKQK